MYSDVLLYLTISARICGVCARTYTRVHAFVCAFLRMHACDGIGVIIKRPYTVERFRKFVLYRILFMHLKYSFSHNVQKML